MKRFITIMGILLLAVGFTFADIYFEGATDGTLDQEWDFNVPNNDGRVFVADSTGSAWGSHVIIFEDTSYTGLTHLKNVMTENLTIEADIWINDTPGANLVYQGLAIKMAHDETQYYRFVYRSASSNNGQLRLQGYDGASWHISQSWNPGTDFDTLRTGWHNFKIHLQDNQFWAYIDGKLLPGGPFTDDSPFLTEGYPGIYNFVYSENDPTQVIFDNFEVRTPGLIDVTLVANTATLPDTLSEDGFVEVRGALNENWATGPVLPGGKIIAWDTSSDLDMVNAGGDYWKVTFQMVPHDTLKYKFWTGHNSETGTHPNGGWEGTFDNGYVDTRLFIAGTNDTVVPVQFYNPDFGTGAVDQYFKPYEPKADSLAVWFRVNMGGEMESERFDPTQHGPIGVRGAPETSGGTIDWGSTRVILNWEENSVYDGSFWSGVAYFDKDSVTAGTEQAYKFFAENTPDFSWEDGDNHFLSYPVGLQDTTIFWRWFNNKKVTGVKPVESIITWRVSTEALEAVGLFDRGVGDEIEIRGPRGWGGDEAVQLNYNPLLQEWTTAAESFNLPPGTEIFYKYFVNWDSSRADETSDNYIPILDLGSGWEEPAITGGGNRTHVYQDAATQTVQGDFGFDRQFFNSIPANGVFDHNIDVTWNVDMTNATIADSNDTGDLFRPGTDTVFVRWDGELLGITQGFNMGGDHASDFLILEDPDGDMIYSGTFTIEVSDKFPNGWYQLGYLIAYSTTENGIYVVNGGGFDFGRRYMQYIHPSSLEEGSPWPTTIWPTEYDLPTVRWKAEDLFVEFPPPDLTVVGIEEETNNVPFAYNLEQNYPNPFNPTTTINYTLPEGQDVAIKVYNINGQLVKTLINTFQPQGNHFVRWNGQNEFGNQVASGVYFVEMIAKDYVKVRKMTLLR